MTRWIDDFRAAELLQMDRGTLRRLIRSSDNPPPYVRPSSRIVLFDADSLLKWQQTWTPSIESAE
jgi:hypothetical protein